MQNPLTLDLLLVRDVGPICLIDIEVNKQKKKMHKPFSLAVDLGLIL